MNQPEPQIEPELVEQFATEFAVNQETALEMLQWMDERLCNAGGLDEAVKVKDFFRDAMKMLVSVQSRQHGASEIRMSTLALCMALGFDLVAGASSSAELGRKCGLSRAVVNNCLNELLRNLKMESLPNQRDDEARKNMVNSRIKNLKHDN